MPAKPRSNSVWDKLAAAVRNDPKRAAVLTVLVIILGVLQIRLQMKRSMEQSAMASSAVINPNKSNNAGTNNSATPAPKPVSSATWRGWIEAPPQPLTRNLFAIDLEQYAADNSRPLATNNGANE